jgi:uncharacterized membrane protein
MSPKRKEYLILGIILFLGFIIRLYHFSSFSLSNDELSAIYRLHFDNLHDLFIQGVGIDFHPAGVQIFLYYWTHIFGTSVAAIRIPFIIAGTLAILFIYLFSRRWFGSTPSLLSAAGLAFLSFPIMYSQIARPYSSGLLFILVLAWLWSIVLFPTEKEKKHIWVYSILLGFAFAFNLYNHYFSALLAFIIGISAIIFLNKTNIKTYFTSTIIGTLLFIPHINMTLYHFAKGGLSSWLGAPDWTWPIGHITFIFNSFIILSVLIIVIIVLRQLSPSGGNINNNSKLKIRSLLWIFFLLPMSIGLFYSLYINPVLQDSILIFSMPFILVWIFSFAPSTINKNTSIAIGFLSLIFIVSSFTIHQERAVNVQNFKGVAEHIQQWNAEDQSSNTIFHIMDSNSPDYIKYYLGKDTSTIHFAQWKIESNDDLLKLQTILDTTKAEIINYVVLAPASALAWNMIVNQFPFVKHRVYYQANTQAFSLSKTPNNNTKDLRLLPENSLSHFYATKDSVYNLQELTYSDGLVYHFNQQNIDSQKDSNFVIIIKGSFMDSSNTINAHIVFSIKYDNGDSYWSSAPLHFFLKTKQQQSFVYKKTLPRLKDQGVLKVYIWNPKKDAIRVSNFNILLHKIKKPIEKNSSPFS